MSLINSRHHKYDTSNYEKWRLTYEGGSRFRDQYLQQFSTRENATEFAVRRIMSYVPAFAKSAVLEIKNSIFDRMADVTRTGGSKYYQESIHGLNGGVDMLGSKMSDFIGSTVLPELLVMAKVGVYVDRPEDPGTTMVDVKKPYLYAYAAEDILSWSTDLYGRYLTLLLRSKTDKVDPETGLVIGSEELYRFFQLTDSGVILEETDGAGVSLRTITLNLPTIPFVLFEISDSLLRDVADYQIALLNVASSDLSYTINANFPFYTEQYSPQADFATRQTTTGTAAEAAEAGTPRIETGVNRGRRYPKGLERPDFIAPPTEPLQASMAKQENMKAEIRQLLHLALTNIRPQRQSGDSKEKDNQGLEAGLSAIGMELARGERLIAQYWADYEGTEIATVEYPSSYSLRSEDDRLAEAKTDAELLPKIPSLTFQKQLAKRIALLILGNRVSNETWAKIEAEIDAAQVVSIDPEVMKNDHEAGFVSTETASRARLYPEGESEQAAIDHAERAARIAIAQSSVATADGSQDAVNQDPEAAKEQKEKSQNKDMNPEGKKKVRS